MKPGGFRLKIVDYQSMSLRARRSFVLGLQEAMSAFEACPVPVIAAVHGHCVGAGEGGGSCSCVHYRWSFAQLCGNRLHHFAPQSHLCSPLLTNPPYCRH